MKKSNYVYNLELNMEQLDYLIGVLSDESLWTDKYYNREGVQEMILNMLGRSVELFNAAELSSATIAYFEVSDKEYIELLVLLRDEMDFLKNMMDEGSFQGYKRELNTAKRLFKVLETTMIEVL